MRDGLRTPVGVEDCLTLNVFRPANARRDLPVLVFVHGGSNVVGYSADPTYDGRQLARRAGAVVVTVNYRLGLFGWLDHPGLKTGEPRPTPGTSGSSTRSRPSVSSRTTPGPSGATRTTSP